MNKTIYLTKKDANWRVGDKSAKGEKIYHLFKTRKEAFIYMESEYKNTNTRAIISGANGKFQLHIIFKKEKQAEVKFLESTQELDAEEKKDISSLFQEPQKEQIKQKKSKKKNGKSMIFLASIVCILFMAGLAFIIYYLV